MSLLARQMFNYESYFRGNLDSSNIFWFRFISVIKPRRIKVWSKTKEGKIFLTKKKKQESGFIHSFLGVFGQYFFVLQETCLFLNLMARLRGH